MDREASMSTLNTQVGGAHYKDCPIQPVEYIHANKVGYFEGNVIKYVTRWKAKGGLDDLRKARHYLDLLIDLEGKDAATHEKKFAKDYPGHTWRPAVNLATFGHAQGYASSIDKDRAEQHYAEQARQAHEVPR